MKSRVRVGTWCVTAGWLLLPLSLRAQTPSPLPKVVLIGDSIRIGYAPVVARLLSGKATVVTFEANGGDSNNVLANLEQWAMREKPDVIHFNAGLHDLKFARQTRTYQVPLEAYRKNLVQIIERLRKATSASVVFASTTPIVDERHATRGAEFDRFQVDVTRYNEAAISAMKGAGVPVNDLHWLVTRNGAKKLLLPDGTHYTPDGYELLGRAVADCITRHLVIRRYTPLPATPSGTDAADSYREQEKERDHQVPEYYKATGTPDFALPRDAAAWQQVRPEFYRKTVESLGKLPPHPAHAGADVISREIWPTFSVEKIAIPNGTEGTVSALFLIPARCLLPAPAILWLHSSTPDNNQILIPGCNGGTDSLGEAFTRQGYVVLSPDAYWHGDRVGTGPSGPAEVLREEQESLFKFHLWMGRTLWGMFVRDDQVALDYLCTRPEVDRSRIGATGMSMGSTRAWWLAAVDDRISAVAAVACLTRYQNLIAHGQLRQHGVYYFVNGLLPHFDTEGVIALIAPRPFLALTGDLDAGSPIDGIRVIEQKVGALYGRLGAAQRFRNIVYPNVGHSYTPEMRAEMLAWFARWLR